MIPRRLLDTTVGLTEISMIWLTRWIIILTSSKTHQRTSVVVVAVIIAVSHKEVVGSVISVAITHP